MRLTPDNLRAFLGRPWASQRRSKEHHWARTARARGALFLLRQGDELRRHVQALLPGWPAPADRDADLRHHVRLQRLLRRFAHARTPRRGR